MRTAAVLLLTALAAYSEPRRTAAEFPVHVSTPQFDIGVEYTVHSYSGAGSEDQMYFTRDFLVFAVAVFPKQPLQLPEGPFELTVNNAKHPIDPVQAEFVAASVRNPEWTTHPQMQVGGGIGDIGGTMGGPSRTERFPGDPNAQSRLPRPPQAPSDDKAQPKTPVDPGKIAIDSALPSGRIVSPVSGNIYFPYTGNAAKIKHLVLHFAAGGQTLDLTVR